MSYHASIAIPKHTQLVYTCHTPVLPDLSAKRRAFWTARAAAAATKMMPRSIICSPTTCYTTIVHGRELVMKFLPFSQDSCTCPCRRKSVYALYAYVDVCGWSSIILSECLRVLGGFVCACCSQKSVSVSTIVPGTQCLIPDMYSFSTGWLLLFQYFNNNLHNISVHTTPGNNLDPHTLQ